MVLSPVVVIIREFCLQHCRRHYHCLRFRCHRLRHRLGATRRLTRHTLLSLFAVHHLLLRRLLLLRLLGVLVLL